MNKSLTRFASLLLAVILAVSPLSAEPFSLCSRASRQAFNEFPEIETYQPAFTGNLEVLRTRAGRLFSAAVASKGFSPDFDGGGAGIPFRFPVLNVPPTVKGGDQTGPIEEALRERRLRKALEAYDTLEEEGTLTGEDHYLAAYIWLLLQRSDRAEPLLAKAKKARAVPPAGWPSIKILENRVKTIENLMPPLVSPAPSRNAKIRTFAARSTAFNRPLFAALPAFAAVGEMIFGADMPSVRLILFSARLTYEEFFAAAFGRPGKVSWQDGTGTINTVVFSETGKNGRITRPPGTPETIGNVLHEFGHSWWQTYLNENYDILMSDRQMPPWLNEGLAEYVAWMGNPAYLASQDGYIKNRVRAGVGAPSFESLTSGDTFYRNHAKMNYLLSALLVKDLLGPAQTGAALIDDVLDRVGEEGPEAAVKAVTGKDPRAVYEALTRRFWGVGT